MLAFLQENTSKISTLLFLHNFLLKDRSFTFGFIWMYGFTTAFNLAIFANNIAIATQSRLVCIISLIIHNTQIILKSASQHLEYIGTQLSLARLTSIACISPNHPPLSSLECNEDFHSSLIMSDSSNPITIDIANIVLLLRSTITWKFSLKATLLQTNPTITNQITNQFKP